ncbi:MAG: rRNA maturation RNase YbeY, partial [Firmicutes bacterium]|nr:rRNA maturation RNase YbeY [Bacillota bacterium]
QYRGVDAPTDVLSFAMEEGEFMPGGEDEGVILGDVVISLQAAERQAKEYGHSFRRELAYLTVHGVLHLLGYDHQSEEDRTLMRRKEEEVLTRLGQPRV